MITEEEIEQLKIQLNEEFKKDSHWILYERDDKYEFSQESLEYALNIGLAILMNFVTKYQIKMSIPIFIPSTDSNVELMWFDGKYNDSPYNFTLEIDSKTKELNYYGINRMNDKEIWGTENEVEKIVDLFYGLHVIS